MSWVGRVHECGETHRWILCLQPRLHPIESFSSSGRTCVNDVLRAVCVGDLAVLTRNTSVCPCSNTRMGREGKTWLLKTSKNTRSKTKWRMMKFRKMHFHPCSPLNLRFETQGPCAYITCGTDRHFTRVQASCTNKTMTRSSHWNWNWQTLLFSHDSSTI